VTVTDREKIYDSIGRYIEENFLEGSGASELTGDAPLLEWGILTSMNTARLLSFIRNDLSVVVPPTHLTGANFTDLNAITDMVYQLSLQPA
jgi:acyl carrier protein